MKPKFIVYCLAAICLAFGFKGLSLTEDINQTLAENARQSESSIMEIGMCFDWYGVIIVNSVIQTSHGIMSPEEMVEVLEEESGYKDEYLEGYKKDITPKDSIPEMYEMTEPTIEAINNIMDTKMYYNEEQSEVLHGKIESYSDFMVLMIVLAVVMSICASFSKRCR